MRALLPLVPSERGDEESYSGGESVKELVQTYDQLLEAKEAKIEVLQKYNEYLKQALKDLIKEAK